MPVVAFYARGVLRIPVHFVPQAQIAVERQVGVVINPFDAGGRVRVDQSPPTRTTRRREAGSVSWLQRRDRVDIARDRSCSRDLTRRTTIPRALEVQARG